MRWVYRVLALITFGPWVVWLGSFLTMVILGRIFGCTIDESGVHPCQVPGQNLGEYVLAAGFMAVWGMLQLSPIAIAGGVAWAATAFFHRRYRRRAAATDDDV